LLRKTWNSIGSSLFFKRSAFRNFRQVLALEDSFVDVKSTVACAEFGNVGVAVVARANYVSIDFEVAGCKSAGA
jgi:hypothetical protein